MKREKFVKIMVDEDQVISQYGGLIKLDISKNEKINIKKF